MKKIEVLNRAYETLKSNNISDWEDSAKRLLAHVLEREYVDLYTMNSIDDEYLDKYFQLIEDRSKHVPLDKLIGYRYFFDIKIPFDRRILTPRVETELLVDRIIMDIKLRLSSFKLSEQFSPISILDMCTGSGCIGLAIAQATGVNVTMSDIDEKVLDIAKSNNNLNNEDRATKLLPAINPNFLLSDMFENIPFVYDIIICNPPYVKTQDLNKLEIEVRDFDPILALDGGKDGLDFYRKIASDAHKHLRQKGKIYLEIGVGQAKKITKMLEKKFENIEIIQDLAGIDRFIIAQKRE